MKGIININDIHKSGSENRPLTHVRCCIIILFFIFSLYSCTNSSKGSNGYSCSECTDSLQIQQKQSKISMLDSIMCGKYTWGINKEECERIESNSNDIFIAGIPFRRKLVFENDSLIEIRLVHSAKCLSRGENKTNGLAIVDIPEEVQGIIYYVISEYEKICGIANEYKCIHQDRKVKAKWILPNAYLSVDYLISDYTVKDSVDYLVLVSYRKDYE